MAHSCRQKKGGQSVGKTKRGKGSKINAIADRTGLPIAVHVSSASPAEVTLLEPTIESRFLEDAPIRLIGDKAYDSDAHDARLAERDIELIAPNRSNRRVPTQDGRALRRLKRRWRVERQNDWLQNYRRIVVRYEHSAESYLGFVRLACAQILLRQCL